MLTKPGPRGNDRRKRWGCHWAPRNRPWTRADRLLSYVLFAHSHESRCTLPCHWQACPRHRDRAASAGEFAAFRPPRVRRHAPVRARGRRGWHVSRRPRRSPQEETHFLHLFCDASSSTEPGPRGNDRRERWGLSWAARNDVACGQPDAFLSPPLPAHRRPCRSACHAVPEMPSELRVTTS